MKKTIYLSIAVFLFGIGAKAQVSYPTVEKGLSFKSKDQKVKIGFGFRMQSLVSYQDNIDGTNPEMKAMIRRMRFKSKGYIYSPKLEYKLELALSNRDQGITKDASQVSNGSKIVLDAVLKYHLSKNQQIWFGQTKLPGNRERIISSSALQFVDRSSVNSKFNIDRDFGVQYRLKQNIGKIPIIIAAAISTGEGRNITAANEKSGMAYTGKVEFFPFGKFAGKGAYFGGDLKREDHVKLAIATSYSYNQNTIRQNGQGGKFVYVVDTSGNKTEEYLFNDISTFFVDAMLKYNGISVMAEYANRNLQKNLSGFSSGSGVVGQVGYLFDNSIEVSGRYTSINIAKGLGYAFNTTEYTLGFSKYIVGHKLKIQSDIAYIDSENSSTADYRFRFQLELGI